MRIPHSLRDPFIRAQAIRNQEARARRGHYSEIRSLAKERGWIRPKGENPSNIFEKHAN